MEGNCNTRNMFIIVLIHREFKIKILYPSPPFPTPPRLYEVLIDYILGKITLLLMRPVQCSGNLVLSFVRLGIWL